MVQRFPEKLQPALTLLRSPACAHMNPKAYTSAYVWYLVTNCLFLSYNFEFNIAIFLMFPLRGNQLFTILEVSC